MVKRRKPSPKKRAVRQKRTSPSGEERLRRKLVPARLADKLRRIRRFHGLSQGKMLLIINPQETDEDNRARVSQYENDKRIPSLIEIFNYAKFANLPIETLIDDNRDLPEEYNHF